MTFYFIPNNSLPRSARETNWLRPTRSTSSPSSEPTGWSGPSSSRPRSRWTVPGASPPGRWRHTADQSVRELPQVHVQHLGAVRCGLPRHLHGKPGRLHDPTEGVSRPDGAGRPQDQQPVQWTAGPEVHHHPLQLLTCQSQLSVVNIIQTVALHEMTSSCLSPCQWGKGKSRYDI